MRWIPTWLLIVIDGCLALCVPPLRLLGQGACKMTPTFIDDWNGSVRRASVALLANDEQSHDTLYTRLATASGIVVLLVCLYGWSLPAEISLQTIMGLSLTAIAFLLSHEITMLLLLVYLMLLLPVRYVSCPHATIELIDRCRTALDLQLIQRRSATIDAPQPTAQPAAEFPGGSRHIP